MFLLYCLDFPIWPPHIWYIRMITVYIVLLPCLCYLGYTETSKFVLFYCLDLAIQHLTLLPHPADTQIHMFLLYCLDFPIRPPTSVSCSTAFTLLSGSQPSLPFHLGFRAARLSVPCHSGAPSAFARLGWVSALQRCLADSLAPCFSDTVD